MYIFSSTSGIMPSALAQDLAHPGRLLIGHPFNPPHVLPLVEVVPGETTDPATVEAAVAFYTALGKTPVVLHKEIGGFVANRLQSAIFVRAAQLTDEGRCSDEQAALAKLFCT
ncbi:MAG TPA: 3-hydroxyacyl-CoA dehydrogenase NAD-binding domain-containing protein, partial [Mycobacterium sp.]